MYMHPMMVISEQIDAIQGSLEQATVSTVALALPDIPSGAKMAHLSVGDAGIRYTEDGTTPTDAIGHPAGAGADFNVLGRNNLERFRMIATSTDSTVTITYYGVTR